jgi:acyl-CoA synthetase (AMP-forming)/AMP-acid ligase II
MALSYEEAGAQLTGPGQIFEAAPVTIAGVEYHAFKHAPASLRDEIRDDVAGRLAPFKVPTQLAVVPEPLPRNAAGKVLKTRLREDLARPGGWDQPR